MYVFEPAHLFETRHGLFGLDFFANAFTRSHIEYQHARAAQVKGLGARR